MVGEQLLKEIYMISKMLKKCGWIHQPESGTWNRPEDDHSYTTDEALRVEYGKSKARRAAALQMIDDVADAIGGDL